MARLFSFLLSLGLLALQVSAQCMSAGVDFNNGGQYSIDQSDNSQFSFSSVFQGCPTGPIEAILVSPNGDQYVCSNIQSQNGVQQTSTCGIPKSSLYNGDWLIVMHADNFDFDVQRRITLTVGVPQTVVVTVRPTVVVGITSTPAAQTVYQTIEQTATILYLPATVTQQCGNPGQTQTITNYENGPIVTVTNTREQVITNAQTSYYQTTVTSWATCHWPTEQVQTDQPAATDVPWVWGGGRRGGSTRPGPGRMMRLRRDVAAVAAVTSTVIDSSNPVTSTQIEYVPAEISTQVVYHQTTTTVFPPAQTVCNAGAGTVTVVHQGEAQTQTQDYDISRTTEVTQWVGQTQYSTVTDQAQATQCWQAGGNYY